MQTIDPQSFMRRGLDSLVQRAKNEGLVAHGKITAPMSRDCGDPAPAKREKPCFWTHGYRRPKVSGERFS